MAEKEEEPIPEGKLTDNQLERLADAFYRGMNDGGLKIRRDDKEEKGG